MNFAIHVRAANVGQRPAVEQVIQAFPALIGRDRAAAMVLDGDSSVSKMHASLDVRDGSLLVRDVGSTNGVFVRGARIERDRWIELGPAGKEYEIRVGGWALQLRGQPLTASSAGSFGENAGRTVLEPIPFGAEEAAVASGPMPLSASVERLREPAQTARDAMTALERAVAREIRGTAPAQRASLAGTLRKAYPELGANAEIQALAAQAVPATPLATPAGAALEAIRELARWYVGGNRALESVDDILRFRRRFQEGVDALILGVSQAVAGLDSSRREMHLAEAGNEGYPRDPSAFARVLFDWRSESGDRSAVVRRAFHDLSVHQIALLTAVSAGIRALLDELAPGTIEAERTTALTRAGFWGRLFSSFTAPRGFVETYRRRHEDLASEESAHFALIFGPEFAEEYRALVRETVASSTAPGEEGESAGRGGTQVMAARGGGR